MNSRIYRGSVAHQRLGPVQHAFTYPIFFYGFDLSELGRLHRETALFGYNHFRPAALHDRDYLEPGSDSIENKFRSWLGQESVHRIELFTTARYVGYAFNPVSFYLCFDLDNRLVAAAAEVNNTFGDRHLYLLEDVEQDEHGFRIRQTQSKAFHVSPFMNMEGEYRFEMASRDGRVEFHVDLWREGRPVLQTRMHGSGVPLTSANLLRVLIRFPVSTFLTMPRILKHAAVLYFRKKLPVFTRPDPEHPMTLSARPPKPTDRLAMRLVLSRFDRIRKGRLHLSLPDGGEREFGHSSTGRDVKVRVRNYRLFHRLIRHGEIGLGEAYTAGDLECDDPAQLVSLLIENRDVLANGNFVLTWWGEWVDRINLLLRRNTRRMSRNNIQAHYDLSNEFFQTFLDPTMTYSCGQFDHAEDTLEQAQRTKLRTMIRRARIAPEHHVLEIGSGWGSFAMLAAEETGCRVTSLTLSDEQYRLANARVAAAGLSDRVTVELCDYRDLTGTYDRIVSIEMLEAVGHAYLGTFFRRCDELLKPDGLAVFQVITMPDHRYHAYRHGCDWIRKYIFPGGHLPSLTAMAQAMTRHTPFHLEELTNIGPHYATTLRAWRNACIRNRERIAELGWDEAGYRQWIYYLAYCEAAFATRTLNTLQFTLARATESPDGPPVDEPAISDAPGSAALPSL